MGDVDGHHELLEINVSIPIGVKGSEDVLTKLVRVATTRAQLILFFKCAWLKVAFWAVLHKDLKALPDFILIEGGVELEVLHVLCT